MGVIGFIFKGLSLFFLLLTMIVALSQKEIGLFFIFLIIFISGLIYLYMRGKND